MAISDTTSLTYMLGGAVYAIHAGVILFSTLTLACTYDEKRVCKAFINTHEILRIKTYKNLLPFAVFCLKIGHSRLRIDNAQKSNPFDTPT